MVSSRGGCERGRLVGEADDASRVSRAKEFGAGSGMRGVGAGWKRASLWCYLRQLPYPMSRGSSRVSPLAMLAEETIRDVRDRRVWASSRGS